MYTWIKREKSRKLLKSMLLLARSSGSSFDLILFCFCLVTLPGYWKKCLTVTLLAVCISSRVPFSQFLHLYLWGLQGIKENLQVVLYSLAQLYRTNCVVVLICCPYCSNCISTIKWLLWSFKTLIWGGIITELYLCDPLPQLSLLCSPGDKVTFFALEDGHSSVTVAPQTKTNVSISFSVVLP